MAFLWGLRFDLSATASLLLPGFLVFWLLLPWISEKFTKGFLYFSFTLMMVAALILNFVDVEMVNIVGRRFAWQTLFMVGEAGGKLSGILTEYWPLTLAGFALLGACAFWNWYWIFKKKKTKIKLMSHYSFGFFVFLIFVVSIRGGFQKKPLSFAHSQLFSAASLNQLTLNSTYSVIKSADQPSLDRQKFFNDETEKFRYLNGAEAGKSLLEGKRPTKPQNVVVIILESFGLEYLGHHTPFFNSLAEKSLFFKNGVANGRRSIEGVPSILTGVPVMMDEPFITSPFATNEILKLPQILRERGYETSFFHGGNNGTMYFDSFADGIGFQKYYGAQEYPNKKDHDGVWGIYDEPFLQFFAQTLSEGKKPFFAAVFTLSSHQPYKIPDHLKGQFPEGELPILKAISYTDYALKKFFEKAAEEPWYFDTLFILTADHTQNSFKPSFMNEVSKYKIPIIFFHPKFKWPPVDRDMIVQQIDIPDSILDFLNVKIDKKNPLASSVFIPGDKAATVRSDSRYILISKDFFLDWFPGQQIKMFAMDDPNETKEIPNSDRKSLLENKMKASIEFFSEGMLDNKLLR